MSASLNHTYRLVWSDLHNAFVAVAENVRSRSKGGKRSGALILAAALMAGGAQAQLPSGGQIVAGSGSIAQSGTTMTVTQDTAKMAANWQSFSIGAGNTVNFVQPSASSVALNRVLGSDVSVIQGALNANGQVFLINPNGVLFTPTAQVNVGGIVASTLNLGTDDFMAGRYNFAGDSSNAIINQGHIKVGAGGTAAFIAAKITHTGNIEAPQGNVLMGAGQAVTLDLGGPVKIQVTQGAIDALIEQGGAIKADGGLIYLTAKAAGELATAAINHTGITEANSIATGQTGEIFLMGDMAKGTVKVGGTLKADGGFVETSAADVQVQAGAQVQTGHWLLDPTNITVDTALASTLQGQLASGAATVTTVSGNADAGDITVNSGVTWSSGNTLTLRADRNIAINATLDASGGIGGKLALQYGQSAVAANNTATYTINAPVNLKAGANFSTKQGSDGAVLNYSVVTTPAALQAINATTTARYGRYALGGNISLQGQNWVMADFNGQLDGLGHTISNLTQTGTTWIGLFRQTNNARFSNLNLDTFNITSNAGANGLAYAGALVGAATNSSFYNIGYKNVTVSGGNAVGAKGEGAAIVGGLIGRASESVTIDRVRGSVINVSGLNGLGGLIGTADFQKASLIRDVQLNGVTLTMNGHDQNALSDSGGLIGNSYNFLAAGTTITRSSAINLDIRTKSGLFSNGAIGGLVGYTYNTKITESYTAGSIVVTNPTTSTSWMYGAVGGLVGLLQNSIVENSYSRADVTLNGNQNSYQGLGGLVGSTRFTSTIRNSYAAGKVSSNMTGTAATYIGGLLGNNQTANGLTLTGSYWDTATTTRTNAIGSASSASTGIAAPTALTTGNRYTQATYAGYDFTNIWRIYAGSSYPILRAMQNTLTVQANSLSKVYDGTNFSGGSGVTYLANGVPTTATPAGTLSYSGSSQSARNVGSYVITPGGLSGITRTTQQDFQNWNDSINYTSGTLSITPKAVTLTGLSASNKVYDATTNALFTGSASVSGLVSGDAVSVSGTVIGSFADKNVGTAKPITLSGLSLTGASASNYTFSYPSLSASITKADLTVGGLTVADKVYDGSTRATLSGTPTVTALGSDVLSLSGVAAGSYILGPDAANNKAVRITGIMLGGAAAGNYNLVSNLTGNITPAPLLVKANEFVSSASTTPSVVSQSGCVVTTCVSGISLSGANLGLTFADGVQASNYRPTLQIGNDSSALDVNRALSWSGFNLNLAAATDININSTLTASGASDKVNLFYGQGAVAPSNTATYRFGLTDTGFAGKLNLQAGQNLSTRLGADGATVDFTVVNDATTLQAINNNRSGNFALGSDINLSGVTWTSLGDRPNKFTGRFDGLGHAVNNLSMDVATANPGLFGFIQDATIRNLGVTNANIKTSSGENTEGVGILVGSAWDSVITNTYTTGSVEGKYAVGGLIGRLTFDQPSDPGVTIDSSFSSAQVTGGNSVGGLVGNSRRATIKSSFATGNVIGLSGWNSDNLGGLVGYNGLTDAADISTIENSYASGNVTGSGTAASNGGLVGQNNAQGRIINSYATGLVTGAGAKGGLVGDNVSTGTVTNSYYDKTVNSGLTENAINVGKTTEQLQTLNTFTGANWNVVFDSTLTARTPQLILDGSGVWKMNPRYIPYTLTTIGSGNYTYNASAQTPVEWGSGAILGNTFANWVLGTDYTFTHSGSNSTGFTNAGVYNPVSVTILRSGYQNATVGNSTGNLTIDKAALTVRANDDARFVTQTDSTTGFAGARYTGFVGNENTTNLGGTLAITRSDNTNNTAGSYTLTPSGLTSTNYAFTYENGTYKIVAADQMLVKAGLTTSIYGQTPDYSMPVVQYVAGGNVLSLNGTAQGGGSFTFAESGAPNNTVSFTLQATGAPTSTSGNIKAGSYQLFGTNFIDNTPNFNYTGSNVVYSGELVVKPKAITVDYTARKTYDSLYGILNAPLTPNGLVGSDAMSLGGNIFFEKNFAGGNIKYRVMIDSITGADKDNYVISGAVQSGSSYKLTGTNGQIDKRLLTISGLTAGGTRVYDGTTLATLGGSATMNNNVAGDGVSLRGKAIGNFADKNVGSNKDITVSGISLQGMAAVNYTLVQQTGLTGSITPKTISAITGITAESKTYDQSTSATLQTGTAGFTGMIANDKLTVATATGAFADANAGNGKTVNITGLTLGGVDLGNYTLASTTATTTADIAKAIISAVTGITASNKEYNRSTSATLNTGSIGFTGLLSGDSLSLAAATGAFTDWNVGAGKTVNITGLTLGGASLGNYTLGNDTTTTTADITAKEITVSYTASNKAYDAATHAQVTGSSAGVIGGDTVSIFETAAFTDKNAGTGKEVLISNITLEGQAAANYRLASTTTTTTANISKADLAITGATVADKVYDGTTLATVTGGSITALGNDAITLSDYAYGQFASKDAGTRAVTTAYVLTGTDAGNYNLLQPGGLSGTISKAMLTVTANHDAKFFGEADSLTAGVKYSGFVAGENSSALNTSGLSISRSGVGTQESAGAYTGVLTASGLAATNYDFTYQTGNFTILGADQLLVKAGNGSATYGSAGSFAPIVQYKSGNTVYTLTQTGNTGSGFTFDDLRGGTATFTLGAVSSASDLSTGGTLKVGNYGVTGSAFSKTGNNFDGSNITYTGNLAVTPLLATIAASGVTKGYDGNTAVTGSASLANLRANDLVSVTSGGGIFASKDAGTGIAYTLYGLGLAGADAANYYLGSTTASGTGSITAKQITASYSGDSKTYDGGTSATVFGSFRDIIAGDVVSLAHTGAAFADKNVGNGKTINVSGISLGGAQAGNYSLASTTATASANITRLNSVTWTGGATGNWFDPANWAGGAVPDLSNVANVVIPANVVVSFNNTVTPPAQAGTVNVNSIGTAGGLDVAAGTLTVTNHVDLGRYVQTGGTVGVGGNFSIGDHFNQSGGSLAINGNADITHTSGDTAFGNIAVGGTLGVSAAGDITQTSGSSLAITGATTLSSRNGGNITLDNADNDFIGAVAVAGRTITLKDSNAIALGTINATHDLTVTGRGITQAGGGRMVGGVTTLNDLSAIPASNTVQSAAIQIAQIAASGLAPVQSVNLPSGGALLFFGSIPLSGKGGGTQLSNGLAFVDLPASADNPGSPPTETGGRDPSGFMKVFVVRGGVRYIDVNESENVSNP